MESAYIKRMLNKYIGSEIEETDFIIERDFVLYNLLQPSEVLETTVGFRLRQEDFGDIIEEVNQSNIVTAAHLVKMNLTTSENIDEDETISEFLGLEQKEGLSKIKRGIGLELIGIFLIIAIIILGAYTLLQ